MDLVPLQLKVKNFSYEIHDYNSGNEQYILKIMIKDFLKKWEKYGIRLLN